MKVKLNVGFENKDEVKKAGATWNAVAKKWEIEVKDLSDLCSFLEITEEQFRSNNINLESRFQLDRSAYYFADKADVLRLAEDLIEKYNETRGQFRLSYTENTDYIANNFEFNLTDDMNNSRELWDIDKIINFVDKNEDELFFYEVTSC